MKEDQTFGKAFIAFSREKLPKGLLPKLVYCLTLLPEEEIWRRPNENVNSVGNIILHLSGNVRQWITSGIGGAEDIRNRPEEFKREFSLPKEELLKKIENVVKEADGVLARLDPRLLGDVKTIQGYEESCMDAIYHVVEHFAYHLGQVVHVTKAALNIDLGFTHLTPEGYKPNSIYNKYI